MNGNNPLNSNIGDIELFDDLHYKYPFCSGTELTAIECRSAETHINSGQTGQNVTCDTRNGLYCYNEDQAIGSSCMDYEIRVYCDCGGEI